MKSLCQNQVMDWGLLVGSFVVGIVVGLTGMGGGALMTPMLVLFFGVPPLTAVSSDLVASAVMKPVGSIVHLRRKTVNLRLVGFLCIGSVPAAFCGVLILKALGNSADVQVFLQYALGSAILLTAILLGVRAYLRLVERAKSRDGQGDKLSQDRPEVVVRVVPTILLGCARRPRGRDDVRRIRVAHHHRPDDAVPRAPGEPARRNGPRQAVPLVASAASAMPCSATSTSA